MLGKCERRLWKQQEHGGYGIPEWLAGSKRVQVKGGMLLLAPTPGKHRPAKPFGKSGLNTFGKGGRKNGAGFLKVAGFWRK